MVLVQRSYRLWIIQGFYYGSFKDHILSTPGWVMGVDIHCKPRVP